MSGVPIVGARPKRQVQLLYLDPLRDTITVKSPEGIGHVKVENLLRRGIHALQAGYSLPSLAFTAGARAMQQPMAFGDIRTVKTFTADVTIMEYDDDDERKMLCVDIFGIAPFHDFVIGMAYRALDGVQRFLTAQAIVARLALTDMPQSPPASTLIV